MSEHPTPFELERYAQATLAADDLLRVDDHLAECVTCRDRAAGSADLSRRLGATVSAVKRDLVVSAATGATAADVTAFPARRSRMTGLSRWVAAGAVAATAAIAVNVVWGTRQVTPTPVTRETPVARAVPDRVDPFTPEERALVDGTLASGRLTRPKVLDMVSSTSGPLMGDGPPAATFGPTQPVGVVVDTDKPSFEWQPAGPGAQYRVSVFNEAFEPVATSGWLKSAQWTVGKPLERGKAYIWQVTARVGGQDTTAPAPPQPEARFMITTLEQSTQLASLRKRAGDSHLALAVLLAAAGVLDEAQRELAIASMANPDSSAVKRLQASLTELRRR